jgi:hypothetical protein
MKLPRFVASVLLAALFSALWADYKSLTKEELDRLEKAYAEAKFYPVYADLAAGADTMTVDSVDKLSEAYLGSNKFVTRYRFNVTLKAGKIEFKRSFEVDNYTEVDTATVCGRPSALKEFFFDAGKIGAGFTAGILTGLLVCRK